MSNEFRFQEASECKIDLFLYKECRLNFLHWEFLKLQKKVALHLSGLAGPTSQFSNGTLEVLRTGSAHGSAPLSSPAPVCQSVRIWRVVPPGLSHLNWPEPVFFSSAVCARLAQLVRSLTANQKVPGSIPGLVEG